MIDLTDEQESCTNQASRGDFSLSKVVEGSTRRLASAPFRVTSQTTGESHVLVTDENGMLSTASSWNPHSHLTNANDKAVDETGTIDQSLLDAAAGIWFVGSLETDSEVDDLKGALPYDTYTVSELRCEANEGLTLVEFDVIISRDGRDLDLGTAYDQPERNPRISTTLSLDPTQDPQPG